MVDVDGDEMTRLIAFLREHGTVVEPTLNVFHGQWGARNSASAWDATFGRLVKRLYDANVALLAGTDGPPERYLVELELYERAGIPPTRILQIATIEAARVMKEDAEYGSIVAGKIADLVIVEGRPSERIRDLAGVETVIRAGRVYAASELLAAVRR
jgi:imidazolonepropionase-like amidohydrolase